MRYLISTTLIFILPLIACAQTKAQYTKVMDKYIKCYNALQYDSVYDMFDHHDDALSLKNKFSTRNKWTMESFMEKYGTIISYTYSGIDTFKNVRLAYFKTKWSKGGEKTSCFGLDAKNKFTTWRMIAGYSSADSARVAKYFK